MSEADEKQSNLLNSISKFNDKDRPESKKEKEEKSSTYESVNDLDEGRELTLNTFISDIFPLKSKQGKGYPQYLASRLKILSPKQMHQKLPIALAEVISENLLSEIGQIIYSF